MSNQEVINKFMNGKSAKSSNGNLWTSSDNNRLMNYATCIAQRLSDGTFIVNSTKYSVTTSQIQTKVRRTLRNYKEVTDIRIHTAYLI